MKLKMIGEEIVKTKIVKLFVSFQKDFLQVEKLGGINEHFIFFNPEVNEGFKIQLTEKIFIKEDSSNELINILEYEHLFTVVNSLGVVIASSDDLNPEFVDLMIDDLITVKKKDKSVMN
jgi:hypothetical protein